MRVFALKKKLWVYINGRLLSPLSGAFSKVQFEMEADERKTKQIFPQIINNRPGRKEILDGKFQHHSITVKGNVTFFLPTFSLQLNFDSCSYDCDYDHESPCLF